MPIKKITITGLTNTSPTGSHFTGIGAIRFYDKDGQLINSGTTISDTGLLYETDVLKVVPSSSYDNTYRPSRAFDTTLSGTYWISSNDNQTLTIDFKVDILNISKITFIPVPFTNRLIDAPVTITAYNENNEIYNSYTVNPLTTLEEVQTVLTPDFKDYVNKVLFYKNSNETVTLVKGVVLNETAIPKMTGRTVPSGAVTQSSYHNSYQPYEAFDRVLSGNGWLSVGGQPYGWLAYEFPEPKIISGYSVLTTVPRRAPNTWTFEGSNGNDEWVVLDSHSGISDWDGVNKKTFYFDNNDFYKLYRINVTLANGDTTYLSVTEMEMFEKSKRDSYLQLETPNIKNFTTYGMNSPIDTSLIYTGKTYISDYKSENRVININRKPLSILITK